MSKITYQNLIKWKKVKEENGEPVDQDDNTSQGDVGEHWETIQHEETQTFILNNILMSVQFFKNFERDVTDLRQNWFKDKTLKEGSKKCFYADSLFKVVGHNVKFQPRHGKNKDLKSQLHPLRIFLINENVEAAYDPTSLADIKSTVRPVYQFTVKPSEDNKKEKSGYVSLVEFRTIEQKSMASKDNISTKNLSVFSDPLNSQTKEPLYQPYSRKIVSFEATNSRKMTKTEKLLSLQKKTIDSGKIQRNSIKFQKSAFEETIPRNGSYDYWPPEARMKPKLIHSYRMNNLSQSWQRIPKQCFQTVDVKKSLKLRKLSSIKKNLEGKCFTTQNLLNSAAYKGYFCDELIEKLAEVLNFDSDAVNEAKVFEEFVEIDQHENRYLVTPVIELRDWNKYLEIGKKLNRRQCKQVEWPTAAMKKILKLLPCYAVPIGCLEHYEDSIDYEKEWKLVFPKAEEFLLLHMMHAHIRCYLFVLTIHKTFIESEINSASFGPKHLRHLLFWLVHKDFLAWPEDKPGETLLNFLKVLYRKLQNKSLCDFFMTSRNLFAHSFLRDLHKVQGIIKKILENPVPYVLSALRNLHLEPQFYPTFNFSTFHGVLIRVTTQENKRKLKLSPKSQEGKSKRVRFEEDDDRLWKKIVYKQIYLEKKIDDEEERSRTKSVDSINLSQIPTFGFQKSKKFYEILGIFLFHFLEMGFASTKHGALNQALIYLNLTNKLYELSLNEEMELEKLLKNSNKIQNKVGELKKECDILKKSYLIESTLEGNKSDVKNQMQTKRNEDQTNTPIIVTIQKREDNNSIKANDSDTDDELETKL